MRRGRAARARTRAGRAKTHGRQRCQGAALVALAVASLAWAGSAPAAQIQSIEAVGTATLPAQRPPGFDPRAEALQAAIGEAVLRVAEDLSGQGAAAIDRQELIDALGAEPRNYASRYRLLEDRGEREALFAEGTDGGREYVVVAAVDVDTERVRERLVAARLLSDRDTGPARALRLEVLGLDTHAAYAAFTRALAAPLGRERVLPVEIERGRAIFEIQSSLDLDRLLAQLSAQAPGELDVVRLAPDGISERLAVHWNPSDGESGSLR